MDRNGRVSESFGDDVEAESLAWSLENETSSGSAEIGESSFADMGTRDPDMAGEAFAQSSEVQDPGGYRAQNSHVNNDGLADTEIEEDANIMHAGAKDTAAATEGVLSLSLHGEGNVVLEDDELIARPFVRRQVPTLISEQPRWIDDRWITVAGPCAGALRPCGTDEDYLDLGLGGPAFAESDDETRQEPREYSVCALFYFVRRIDAYEPGLVREIYAIVATRGLTQSETAVGQFLQWMESRESTARRRVVRKITFDKRLARGYGPRPSRVELTLRPICGVRQARRVAKGCIDPSVRFCTCVEHNQFGRSVRRSCFGDRTTARLLKTMAVLAVLIDIADIAVDISLVNRLASEGQHGYAGLLATALAIAIPLEVVLKAMLLDQQKESPLIDDRINREDFLLFCAFTELAVFLIEDATSVFCWYNTDVFDPEASVSLGNLYLTFISALLASSSFLFMLVAAILDDCEVESCGDCCELSLSACSRIGKEVKKLWRRLKGCACMCCCDYSRSDIKHFLGGLYVVIMFFMVQVLLVWWSFVAFEIILPGKQATQSKTMNDAVLALFVVGACLTLSGIFAFFYVCAIEHNRGNPTLRVITPKWWFDMLCGGGCLSLCFSSCEYPPF
eukprot:m.83166 g.83166  ORF g.83166 m.83166 type:complete len:621 (+) comp11177_c0_seq2:331-2193(+)